MNLSLEEMEERIHRDITTARYAYSIAALFLRGLEQACDDHLRNKYAPLTNAIGWACIENLVGSLGRLLQDAAKANEVTLTKYRNCVIRELLEKGPRRNESPRSKKCVNKLCNKSYQRLLRHKTMRLWNKIKPLRDGLVAHSDGMFDVKSVDAALPYFETCINFVEHCHRMCNSALNDTSNPGAYKSNAFDKISKEWINLLTIGNE